MFSHNSEPSFDDLTGVRGTPMGSSDRDATLSRVGRRFGWISWWYERLVVEDDDEIVRRKTVAPEANSSDDVPVVLVELYPMLLRTL